MKEKKIRFLFFFLIICFSILARLLPHPPNFAPIGALSLFSGTYLSIKYAPFIPLLVMIASDYFIGFYELKLMISVYLSFFLICLIGFWLKKNKNPLTIVFSSFFTSLFFYLITNFAVWVFTPWYEKSLSGLILAYTLALPFFRNTILGDLFYTVSFFSVYELILNKELFFSFLKRQRTFLRAEIWQNN